MATLVSTTDADVIESVQDEPQKERRRVLMIVLLVLAIAVLGAITAYPAINPKTTPVEYSVVHAAGEVEEQAAGEAAIELVGGAREAAIDLVEEPADVAPARPNSMPTNRPTLAPTLQPTRVPASIPAAPRQEPTAATGLCSANGGIKWQGVICLCSGLVDQVTVCMDDSKTDTLPGANCTPRPEDCFQPTYTPLPPSAPPVNACVCQCNPQQKYCYDTCTHQKCGRNPNW